MKNKAALYLRSSKDRSDVSIDAQRRELQKLAADRQLAIIQEYIDVVESAKSERRPGFQTLLQDLRSQARGWTTLLMVDTSRLSRRRYAAQVFKHEARKQKIEIVYSNVPDVDPITSVILEAVFEAMDEVHSLMSRDKGLAGMAENVRQGFRAGGRAPRGYRLKRIPTGSMRDGVAVTKSVLEPSEDAALITRYLKARAQGRSRTALQTELGLPWSATSLINMEWNALTYAGHTVWNMRNEFKPKEGYQNGSKYRPSEDWVIQQDTHQALITEAEAKALLQQLRTSKHSQSRKRSVEYLLSGLLEAPNGVAWHGGGSGRYQLRKTTSNPTHKRIAQERLESLVLDHVLQDLVSPAFVKDLTLSARKAQAQGPESGRDRAQPLRRALQEAETKIEGLLELSLGLTDPAPALRKVDALECQRTQLQDELSRLEQDARTQDALRDVTEPQVLAVLQGLAGELQQLPRGALKDALHTLISKIVLDPETLQCRIHYRIALGDKRASPRRRILIPPLEAIREFAA